MDVAEVIHCTKDTD